MDLYEELGRIVDALNEARMDYAVCGGIAVAMHGYARMTKDIDLLVRKQDVERIHDLVRPLGFDLPVATLPFDVGTERERMVVRISKMVAQELLSLDLLVVTPVFEEVWEQRMAVEWRGKATYLVSPAGLAIMKRLAGRLQDLADLENLGLLHGNEGPEDE